MTSNPDQEGRAKLSFDIDEEDDPEASKEAVERKIREISQQSGFTARAVAGSCFQKSRDGRRTPSQAARQDRPDTCVQYQDQTRDLPANLHNGR